MIGFISSKHHGLFNKATLAIIGVIIASAFVKDFWRLPHLACLPKHTTIKMFITNKNITDGLKIDLPQFHYCMPVTVTTNSLKTNRQDIIYQNINLTMDKYCIFKNYCFVYIFQLSHAGLNEIFSDENFTDIGLPIKLEHSLRTSLNSDCVWCHSNPSNLNISCFNSVRNSAFSSNKFKACINKLLRTFYNCSIFPLFYSFTR
jgi:hypothetical protein